MKRLLKLTAPVIALAAGVASATSFAGFELDPAPYAGADAQLRQMKFPAGGPDLLFAKQAFQGNVFVGVQLNKYFGIEGGYEQTEFKKNDNFASAANGDVLFNNLHTGDTQRTSNKHRLKGFNINLLGYFPIVEDCTTLYAGVGLARLKAELIYKIIAIGGPPETNLTEQEVNQQLRSYSASKTIPRLTAGIQQMFTHNLGLRANVTWEKTSKFKKLQPKCNVPEGLDDFVSLKNSTIYGVGVFWKF